MPLTSDVRWQNFPFQWLWWCRCSHSMSVSMRAHTTTMVCVRWNQHKATRAYCTIETLTRDDIQSNELSSVVSIRKTGTENCKRGIKNKKKEKKAKFSRIVFRTEFSKKKNIRIESWTKKKVENVFIVEWICCVRDNSVEYSVNWTHWFSGSTILHFSFGKITTSSTRFSAKKRFDKKTFACEVGAKGRRVQEQSELWVRQIMAALVAAAPAVAVDNRIQHHPGRMSLAINRVR